MIILRASDGLQGLHTHRIFQDKNEQQAYDEGLEFGLSIAANN
jgi:hypothetical protein